MWGGRGRAGFVAQLSEPSHGGDHSALLATQAPAPSTTNHYNNQDFAGHVYGLWSQCVSAGTVSRPTGEAASRLLVDSSSAPLSSASAAQRCSLARSSSPPSAHRPQ